MNTHKHTTSTARAAWFVLSTAVTPGSYVTVGTDSGEVSGPVGYHTGSDLFLMNGPCIPLCAIRWITHTTI